MWSEVTFGSHGPEGARTHTHCEGRNQRVGAIVGQLTNAELRYPSQAFIF